MHQWLVGHFEHVLCGLILFSRLADIGTTYLVTPTLLLEANPVMRKLCWPFAVATTLICLVPYYNTAIGVMVLIPSLLVSATNAARIWAARTLGEKAYWEMILNLARNSRLMYALLPIYFSALCIAITGGLLWLFYPQPDNWGNCFAMGLLLYAFIVAFYGTIGVRRVFRRARESAPTI